MKSVHNNRIPKDRRLTVLSLLITFLYPLLLSSSTIVLASQKNLEKNGRTSTTSPLSSRLEITKINNVFLERLEEIQQEFPIYNLAWSSEGQFLAIYNGVVEIINIEDDQAASIKSDIPSDFDLFWHPNSTSLATIDHTSQVRFTRIEGQDRVLDLNLEESDILESISWSPNGNYISALVSREERRNRKNYTVRVFELGSNSFLEKAHLEYQGTVSRTIWSPDSQYIIMLGHARQSQAKVLEISTNTEVMLPGDRSTVADVKWSPDGQYLIKRHSYSAQIFDMRTREKILDIPRSLGIQYIDWSLDGQHIISVIEDDTLQLLSGTDLSGVVLREYPDVFRDFILWSPDGQSLLVGVSLTELKILEQDTWQELIHIQLDERPQRGSVVWSPDGQYIAIQDIHNSVYVVDTTKNSGTQKYEYEGFVNDIGWSPDSRYLTIQTSDGIQFLKASD